MSDVSSAIAGSTLQSGLAQHNAARALDNERNQQVNAAAAASQKTAHTTEAVDETDNDSQVHTDAEGAGSQGRFVGGDESETGDFEPPGDSLQDAAPNEQDHPHIDLQV